MYVEFSTNNASEAKKRLIKAMGKEAKGKLGLIEFVCKKVEEGKLRVGDPFMYNGNVPVYPTEKCTEQDTLELQNIFKDNRVA